MEGVFVTPIDLKLFRLKRKSRRGLPPRRLSPLPCVCRWRELPNPSCRSSPPKGAATVSGQRTPAKYRVSNAAADQASAAVPFRANAIAANTRPFALYRLLAMMQSLRSALWSGWAGVLEAPRSGRYSSTSRLQGRGVQRVRDAVT